MKAGEEFLLRYLEGHDKRFVIPVYQRNYDWKREQCEQLFEDVLNIVKQKQDSYFIGSIVSIHNDNSVDREYVVIDGQQRITTITLMLLAMHNMLDSNEVETNNPSLKDQIKEQYLLNKYSEEDKRIRLKPIKDDNQAFLKLFGENLDEYVQDSNITLNYAYFVDRIKSLKEHGVSVDELYEAIKKLLIVDIKLKRGEDNPQLIFESLNSTGKKLEEADLVRNFILMDKRPEQQERFYEKFWHPIERNTHYKVGDFIRDYLTYARSKTPRKDRVYLEFKKYVQESFNTPEALEALLNQLLQFSQYYRAFLSFDTKDVEVNEALKRIDRLQVTVSYPFLMDVFHAWHENIIDAQNAAEILNTVESFVFRRMVCNVPTNALNKIFATLGRNIRKVDEFEGRYIDIFKYLIGAGVSSNRFPADEEFTSELTKRDVYNLKGKNRIHLFERLENHNNREKVDVETLIEVKTEGLTFEHIMPQTLNTAWKNDLGENHLQIHEKYLNTIGNMTLTAYNSGLSNKPFLEKVSKENGFKDSRLWLNHGLASLDKWNEEEIKNRAQLLADRSLTIWGFPESSYAPPQKEDTEIGLDEDFSFTGTKPKSFSFLDQHYPVNSWREVYQKTLQLFYELDPVRLKSLIDEPDHKRYLGRTESTHNYSWKMNEHIYLNINLSARSIISIIKSLFVEFDLDEAEFIITLHDDIKQDNKEEHEDLTLDAIGL